MADWDRMKASLFALIRAALPRVDYYAPFYGKVVAQSGNTVDVAPDDPRMPTMSKVPLYLGGPGMAVTVATGTSVIVAFLNGDPARAVAHGWAGSEGGVTWTITADMVTLGGTTGAEPAVKGQTLQSYLQKLAAALTAHTHPVSGALAGPSAAPPTDLLTPTVAPPNILASNVSVK